MARPGTFQPGQSGNPGGRTKGRARRDRSRPPAHPRGGRALGALGAVGRSAGERGGVPGAA